MPGARKLDSLQEELERILEQRGWPGKAIEHYEKFLEVWKDADPDIPEIEDARQRLSDFQSQ